jgi:hypothetical protein
VKFYMGTHMTNWFSLTDVPLFVSARRLRKRKSFHKAKGSWALDSGGFSEISMHGEWMTSPEQYVKEVRLWSKEIGNMDWAAIQDWMCEPAMLKKTGKTIVEHQELTIQSYRELKRLAPEIPWMPVLQGWEPKDYLRHLDMYRAAGFNDTAFGIGSVCRRQVTDGIDLLIHKLHGLGLELHAFGFKTKGLTSTHLYLASSDSLAWSFDARYADPIEGHSHKNCANCIDWALRWRENLLSKLVTGKL